MGRQAAYGPCSTLSEEDMNYNKMGARCELWKTIALVITTVVSLIFLGLFVWQLYSKSSSQSGEYLAQLQNQSTQVQAQLEKCTEALKKDRDEAKKDSDDLRAQLAIATQNLSNNSQRWDSCQKELKHGPGTDMTEAEEPLCGSLNSMEERLAKLMHKLQDNITSQSKEISKEQAEKYKLQEEIKQLQQQISEWENQKKQEPSKSRGAIICGLVITFLLPLLALLLV